MSLNDEILAAVETYKVEFTKFAEKGVMASAARSRAALGDIAKLCKAQRAEIQASKLAQQEAKKAK